MAMFEDAETKVMVRTPYGVLSMPMAQWVVCRTLTQGEQWYALRKLAGLGDWKKARAFQWLWERMEAESSGSRTLH